MLVTEWDMTTALEVEREEGYEKGLVKGRDEGLVKGRDEGLAKGRDEGLAKGRDEGRDELKQEILGLMNNGYTLEAIKEELAKSVNSTRTQ